MRHHYTLYVDEAGDDKLDSLRPVDPKGNSEWLCLGGYLVRSSDEGRLDGRRDSIRRAIGGADGQVLHYRNLNPKNRRIAAEILASRAHAARGYVVCPCMQTMLGQKKPREEAA